MTIAWVLGSNGLLGKALCRALLSNGSELFSPAERFHWDNDIELTTQITTAVQAFSAKVDETDQWEIYWAAGVGTMGSVAASFTPETQALSLLLQRLQSDPHLMATSGSFAFASSAGAIYAGSTDDIITENTVPAPTTDYAREKLLQENLVSAFTLANSRTTALIARISTLYGSGQAAGKKQGLLTHIARSILRNQPIQIYVPYDTIRDYITVGDAANAMIATLRSKNQKSQVTIKIIASEYPATIAEIISIFKRIARRKPLIVTSASKLSSLYSRRVQFRSMVFMKHPKTSATKLSVGIAQLMAAEREAFVRSASTNELSRAQHLKNN